MIVNGYMPGETKARKQRVRKADKGHSVVLYETTLTTGLRFRYAVRCECGKRYTSKQDLMRAIRSWEGHKVLSTTSEESW